MSCKEVEYQSVPPIHHITVYVPGFLCLASMSDATHPRKQVVKSNVSTFFFFSVSNIAVKRLGVFCFIQNKYMSFVL